MQYTWTWRNTLDGFVFKYGGYKAHNLLVDLFRLLDRLLKLWKHE